VSGAASKKKTELKVRPEVLQAAGQVELRTDLFDCQMYLLSRQALRILAAHPNMTSLKVRCSPPVPLPPTDASSDE
jgi:hypothetical protein